MNGAMLETWVIAEVLKSYWHNGLRAPLWFYRDKDQKEIDLLILQDQVLYPIEIRKTAHPGRDTVRHFQALGNALPSGFQVGPGALVCLAGQQVPLGSNVEALPISLL